MFRKSCREFNLQSESIQAADYVDMQNLYGNRFGILEFPELNRPLSKAQSKQAEESLTGVRIKFIRLGTFMVAKFVTRPSTVQFRI